MFLFNRFQTQFFKKMKILLVLYASVGCSYLFAAATYTSGDSAAQLAAKIQGTGITITNPTITRGGSKQRGIFSNAISGANLEIDTGIILTTGSVQESFTTNNSDSSTVTHGTYNDPDLLGIDSRAKYDPIIFEFDVTLDANTRLLMVSYQFASDEYHEYVGSQFNDAFGFFISGGDLPQTYNIARVVDNQTYVTINDIHTYSPVTVNNVNNGNLGSEADGSPTNLGNSAFFISNRPNPTVITEYDGLTRTLFATLDNLTPGETYHFKMALSDTGDQKLDSAVFVGSINGLREPSLCYDYSFKQDHFYLTQEHNTLKGPSLNTTLSNTHPIEVGMYFKNTEQSELTVRDLFVNVLDINTSQVSYLSESVFVTNPGETLRTHRADSTLDIGTTHIKDIPIDSFDSEEYFYTFYSLNPNSLNISIPIKIRLDYNVVLPLSQTQTRTVPRSTMIDEDIPICPGSLKQYNPQYGIFNVVESNLYNNLGVYNINTQVTGRPGNLSVVAMDPDNLNTEINVSTIVGIDMIDLEEFHVSNATCDNSSNSISPRVQVILTGGRSVLNRAALDAINFFGQARRNVALRVSYIVTNDGNEDLIQLQQVSTNPQPTWKVLNFTQLVQDIGTCSQPVINPQSGNPTSQVSVACGNAGNAGVNQAQLTACMDCLFGYNTKFVCSRDNFAIRPEAFQINITDQNQTNGVLFPNALTAFHTGVNAQAQLNTNDINVSGGYNYNLRIVAVDHRPGNNSSPGYQTSDVNATYIWAPPIGLNGAFCNDVANRNLSVNFFNGIHDNNTSISQVGRYSLNITDNLWTSVDWDPTYRNHHVGNANYLMNIAGQAQTDCVVNSNFVATTFQNDNLNGCVVSSAHNKTHQDPTTLNVQNGFYRNINLMFKPFAFRINPVQPFIVGQAVGAGTNFVYMSDINQTANLLVPNNNMYVDFNGTISAVGFNQANLTNFVRSCYAQDTNIALTKSNTSLFNTNGAPVFYQYWFQYFDQNNTAQQQRDINGNLMPLVQAANDRRLLVSEGNLITLAGQNPLNPLSAVYQNPIGVNLSSNYFLRNLNGTVIQSLRLNYDRDVNQTVNPQNVTFGTYSVQCTPNALGANPCTMNANGINNYQTIGVNNLNIPVTHYYGRSYAPRQVFPTQTGSVPIFYEIYCDNNVSRALLPVGSIPSREPLPSPIWYTNTLHTNTFGGANRGVTQKSGTRVGGTNTLGNMPDVTNVTYDGSRGFPYSTTMQHNVNMWLVYDKDNANSTSNEFEVEFIGGQDGSWAGKTDTNAETNTTAAPITNRRIMW